MADTGTPPNGNGLSRNHIATMLAWTLILTVITSAGLAYFATQAPEAFKNWDIVVKLADGLHDTRVAIVAGLLGYMTGKAA